MNHNETELGGSTRARAATVEEPTGEVSLRDLPLADQIAELQAQIEGALGGPGAGLFLRPFDGGARLPYALASDGAGLSFAARAALAEGHVFGCPLHWLPRDREAGRPRTVRDPRGLSWVLAWDDAERPIFAVVVPPTRAGRLLELEALVAQVDGPRALTRAWGQVAAAVPVVEPIPSQGVAAVAAWSRPVGWSVGRLSAHAPASGEVWGLLLPRSLRGPRRLELAERMAADRGAGWLVHSRRGDAWTLPRLLEAVLALHDHLSALERGLGTAPLPAALLRGELGPEGELRSLWMVTLETDQGLDSGGPAVALPPERWARWFSPEARTA